VLAAAFSPRFNQSARKCKKVSRGTDARDLFQFLRHSFSTLRKGFAALGESTHSRELRAFFILKIRRPPGAESESRL
jgi:hypothetical protein